MDNSIDMKKLLADHMEDGFLENIIDMFRHDSGLFIHLGSLVSDERMRVRLGAVALVETLRDDHPDELRGAILSVAEALKDENPTVRADAAYVLGIIGHRDALSFLKEASDDGHPAVSEAVKEAVGDIEGG